MRERLDEHSRFLESQLAGLESMIQDKEQLRLNFNINPALEGTCKAEVPQNAAKQSNDVGLNSTVAVISSLEPAILPPSQAQPPLAKTQPSVSGSVPEVEPISQQIIPAKQATLNNPVSLENAPLQTKPLETGGPSFAAVSTTVPASVGAEK